MAAVTMQSAVRVAIQANVIGAQSTSDSNKSVNGGRSLAAKALLSFSGKWDVLKCANQRTQIIQRKQCSVVCVAAPVDTKVSIDERKQANEESAGDKPYRITEVEFTAPIDYNNAKVLEVVDVAEGIRRVTVDAEISREFVTLDKAHTKPGQKVEIRLSSGESSVVPASSAPFPSDTNHNVLMKSRGDIFAGSIKAAQYGLSVKAPLDLHVSEASAPALYNVQPGTELEVGPFQPGMDLRPIMFLSRFPIILIFASGDGIAAARALIEAKDVGSLYLSFRADVRLYYSAPTPSTLAYKDLWASWEEKSVKLRPTVASSAGEAWDGFVGSFTELFDEDDLEYDPETTGVVACGSKEANDDLMKLLEEAGIPEKAIVRYDL